MRWASSMASAVLPVAVAPPMTMSGGSARGASGVVPRPREPAGEGIGTDMIDDDIDESPDELDRTVKMDDAVLAVATREARHRIGAGRFGTAHARRRWIAAIVTMRTVRSDLFDED